MKPLVTPRFKLILEKLDGHDVVWFGTRGADVEPLLHLVHPTAIVSQVAPFQEQSFSSSSQDCLETRSCRRVDLDRYDIDLDFTKEASTLKLNLLRHVSGPTALVAYRAAEFLASVAFTNPFVHLFAPFHLSQRQLEHKPWVEKQLLSLGVPMLPWKFIRDGDFDRIKNCFHGRGMMVGRTNTGAGGAGIIKSSSAEEFIKMIPSHQDGFIGLTPFISDSIPLNINACVYSTGEVRTFAPSFQLIGVKECTSRSLGYCGNDFAAASRLPGDLHDAIEKIATIVGRWLRKLDFLGVFGLDYLIHDSKIIVTELNPRFQGSTPLNSRLNQIFGWPDPHTEHLAAYLGLEAPSEKPNCREQSLEIAKAIGALPVSQIVYHNMNAQAVRVRSHAQPDSSTGISLTCIPASKVYIDPHAILMKSTHSQMITEDGHHVDSNALVVRGLIDVGY